MPSPTCDPRRGLHGPQLAALERLLASGVPALRARRIAMWADAYQARPAEDMPDYDGPIEIVAR